MLQIIESDAVVFRAVRGKYRLLDAYLYPHRSIAAIMRNFRVISSTSGHSIHRQHKTLTPPALRD